MCTRPRVATGVPRRTTNDLREILAPSIIEISGYREALRSRLRSWLAAKKKSSDR
jgi:hypothetical protein